MPKKSETAIRSVDSLGFNQQDRLNNFLELPEHNEIMKKFESIFPQGNRPKFATLPSNLNSANGEEFMTSDDKEFDLSSNDELSLSDEGEVSPTIPHDDGLEMDAAEDEGFSLSDNSLESSTESGELEGINDLDDLDGLQDPPPLEATMTGLKLGSDLEALDSDVLAKMKEIDEIMEFDATHTEHRADLSEDLNDENFEMTATANRESSTQDDEVFEESGELSGLFLNSTDESDQSTQTEDSEYEKSLVFDPEENMGFTPSAEDELETSSEPSGSHDFQMTEPTAEVSPVHEDIEPMVEEEVSFSNESIPETAKPIISKSPASQPSRPAGQEEYKEVVGHYNAELERLQATLNHLRTDREQLLKKIDVFEEDKIHHQRQMLTLRAELDEKKIETQLMKKRMGEDTQDLRYSLQLEQERRQLAEEKLKAQQEEMAAVQQKIRMEVRKVSGHERELEQQLELLKSDAETQIRNRDMKILELKRRLDAMEFDVENMSALEKKTQENKQELEVKLDKAIRTLRAAIGILEVDDPKIVSLDKLKKTLDV